MDQELKKQEQIEQIEDALNSQQQSQQASSPNILSKLPSSSKHSQHVVIVSNFSEDTQGYRQIVDPLLEQITSMKITQNLIKEMSFTASINKFENLQDLLHKKFDDFNSKIQKVCTNQKELHNRMKQIQGSATSIDRKNKKIDENKLAKDVKDIILLKEETAKYKKLSYGMIHALQQIQKKFDQRIKSAQRADK